MAAKDQQGKDLAKRNFGKAMATLVEAAGKEPAAPPGEEPKRGAEAVASTSGDDDDQGDVEVVDEEKHERVTRGGDGAGTAHDDGSDGDDNHGGGEGDGSKVEEGEASDSSANSVTDVTGLGAPQQLLSPVRIEAANVLLDAATALAAKPDGLTVAAPLRAWQMTTLTSEPFVKHFIELWSTTPPMKSGGFRYSRHAELKKTWKVPSKLSSRFMSLFSQISQMAGALFPQLQALDLDSLSLEWTNGFGEMAKVEDPQSCPYALASISLKHYTAPNEYRLLLNHEPQTSITVGGESEETGVVPALPPYTMRVPEGHAYVMTGAVLRHYTHTILMDETEENQGKVSLRLGFKKRPSVLASELRLYDDYVNARSGEDRADAVAKAKRKSPRLARAASGAKQVPPVARRALQLYSPANDRTVTGTSASSTSSTSKDDYPAETMSTSSSSSSSSSTSSSSSSEDYYPHAEHDIDKKKLAALVSKKGYWMNGCLYHESKDEREKLKEDILDLHQLRFGQDWGCGVASKVKDFPVGGVQGDLYGGTFWENEADMLGASRLLWKLILDFPEAQMGWAHVPEYKKYMIKLVIHGDIEGFKTTPLPKLQGRTEKDWSKLRGGSSLTELRRECVINIDSKHEGPYLHGNRSTATKRTGKSNKEVCKEGLLMIRIMVLVRSKLPAHLRVNTRLVYDISILINGTISSDHTDELDGDGVGNLIVNIYLWGDGVFIFTEESGDPNLPVMGTYVGPNQYTMFTGGLRYKSTHQVLRWQSKPYPLDLLRRIPKDEWRMVLTVRLGKSSAKDTDDYNEAFGNQFDREEALGDAEMLAEHNAAELKSSNERNAVLMKRLAEKEKQAKVASETSPARAQSTWGNGDLVNLAEGEYEHKPTEIDIEEE